jgi:elongation factor Ts
MDNKTSVEDTVAKFGKDNGGSVKLTDYVRFQLGEGIEKEESDFAAEVAAAVGG